MAKHHKPPKIGRRVVAGGLVVGAAFGTQLGTAQAAEPAVDWGPIIACESGGNPVAQNSSSTASGLFQFLDSTWQGLGGSGRAKDASVTQQYAMAERLFAQSGLTPWASSQACWAGKVDVSVKVAAPAPAPKVSAPKHASNLPAPKHAVSQAPKHAAVAGSAYVVVDGDTLSEIAASAHLDWHQLYTANSGVIGSNPDRIFPGQALTL